MSPVADLQVLQGPTAGDGGVGEKDLVAEAFVEVEQRQLRAGVGTFAANDDPGALRIAGQVDQAGELGDFGFVSEGAVGVQCPMPHLFR